MNSFQYDKFIVINRKHINKLPSAKRIVFLAALELIQEHIPDNKYLVCNQDEPYAKRIWGIIQKGDNS